jgi:hypothetical protein
MAKEPNWSPEELKVVDRYVESVRSGRYNFLLDAARACQRELERLGTPRRTSGAVFQKLEARVRASGFHTYRAPWTSQEMRVLRRYAQATVAHRYPGVAKAAVDCCAELESLRHRDPTQSALRSADGIRKTLGEMARASGWSLTGSRLTAEEDGLLDRYVKAVESGRFPGTLAAARACFEDFERLRAGRPSILPKKLATIRSYIWRRWRERNGPRVRQWNNEEDEVIDRYVKAVMAGRYENATQAAADCLTEIAERSPASANRTRRAIAIRISQKAARLGQPRPFIDWTAEEDATIDRFARDLVAGRFGRVADAVEPCRVALHRQAARLGKANGLSPGSIAWRSAPAVRGRLHIRARELGRRRPPNRRWSAEERQTLARWFRWYSRCRRTRRLLPLTEAALGLHDDLAKMGSKRSLETCKGRLGETRRRLCPVIVRPWTPEEEAIRDRYVAAIVEGQFRTTKHAATRCTAELLRLHRRMRKAAPDRYAGTLPRSCDAVLNELSDRARNLGLPRYANKWTVQETRAIERHARGVPSGRYKSWLEAARACHAELKKLHRRIRLGSPVALQALPERKLVEVHKHIIIVSHKLGLEGPRRVLWTAAENVVCDRWVSWYERHRRIRRFKPLSEAVLGFQEELDQVGSARSLSSCRNQLFKRRRYLQEHQQDTGRVTDPMTAARRGMTRWSVWSRRC